MKQERIFVAYKLLERLNRISGLPFKVFSQLYGVKKSLAPYYEAQKEKQMMLFEAAGIDENGQVEITPELKKSIADIMKTDVDFDFEPMTIQLTPGDVEKLGLTGEIMEQLEGIIQFAEVEA